MTVVEFEKLVDWYCEYYLKIYYVMRAKSPDVIGWWKYPIKLRSKIGRTALMDMKLGIKQ